MEREELIDKYLKDELTPSERDQFDILLKQDQALRKEINFIKDLTLVSGVEDKEGLKKNLQHFEAKIAADQTDVQPLFNYTKLLIAASMLFIAIIGGIALLNTFTTDTASLYASNFEPYKNVTTPIVRGTSNKNEEIIAFTSYESKNYKVATDQFHKLFNTTKKPYLLLYQANALLATNDTKEAIPLLERHIAFNDQLVDRGKWYLALAYLKENKKEKSISLLKEIIEKGKFKKSTAERLLKELQ